MRVLLLVGLLACSLLGASGQTAGGGAVSPGNEGGVCLTGDACNQSTLSCIANFCVPNAGLPAAGTTNGPCLTGKTCQAGLQCTLGLCINTPAGNQPAGSLGGVCLANNVCNADLSCVFGYCVSSQGAGTVGNPCTAAGTCNSNDATCFNGVCIPAGSAFGSTGGAGGMTFIPNGGACTNNFRCESGFCKQGTCADFTVPKADCSASPCVAPKVCRYGFCLDPPSAQTCPPCNSAIGEVCDTNWGICVQSAPTCRANCPVGNCVSPVGTGLPAVCVSSSSSLQSCTSNAGCTSGANNICLLGNCVPCGPICNALQGLAQAQVQAITQALGQIGSADLFTTFLNAQGSAALVGPDGRLRPNVSAIFQLDANALAGRLTELNFQAGLNGAAAAQVPSLQALSIPLITAAAASGQLLVGGQSSVTAAQLNVPANGGLTVAIASGSATAQSIAAFQKLTIAGPLSVVGSGSVSGSSSGAQQFTVLSLPERDADVNVTAGASLKVTNGVSLRGTAAAMAVLIGSGAATAAGIDRAFIQSNFTFRASNSILGTKAFLEVSGSFEFTGSRIEPTLNINAFGIAKISGSNGGSVIRVGDVTFTADATTGERTLVIAATTTVDVPDSKVFAGSFDCPANAKITYQVPGSNTRAAAISAGIKVMNFAARTQVQTDGFMCDIQVCDDDGCTQIVNPNQEVVNGGRRLLSDSSSGSATFSSTDLTITGSGGNNSGSVASFSTMFLALAMVAAGALQRLF